ncbi:MAG: Glutamine synthetase type III, GlnN, partial [uncultured Solirubrobacteraceae bacterium]
AGGGGACRRQGDLHRELGRGLRGRQLLGGVACRGRASRAAEPGPDARRPPLPRRRRDGRGVRGLQGPHPPRAPGPLRGLRRAVRHQAQHRGRDRGLDRPHHADAGGHPLPRRAEPGRVRNGPRHPARGGVGHARRDGRTPRRTREGESGASRGAERPRPRPLRAGERDPGHGGPARSRRPPRARGARHALAAAQVRGDPVHQV